MGRFVEWKLRDKIQPSHKTQLELKVTKQLLTHVPRSESFCGTHFLEVPRGLPKPEGGKAVLRIK